MKNFNRSRRIYKDVFFSSAKQIETVFALLRSFSPPKTAFFSYFAIFFSFSSRHFPLHNPHKKNVFIFDSEITFVSLSRLSTLLAMHIFFLIDYLVIDK